MRLLLFFVFLALTPSSLFTQSDSYEYKKVTLFKQGCAKGTLCRTNLKGIDKDFSLKWKHYQEGIDHIVEMTIDGQVLRVPTAQYFINDHPFPLRLYIYTDSLKLYASLCSEGSAGLFINYFLRDKDGRFHHLGLMPILFYDKDSGYFIGGENAGGGEHITYYYKLEKASMVLKNTVNSLDEEN